jgi:hypothetical protein
MGAIADVVPGEGISSTAWGNVIRDRVVQVFDSEADRNAYTEEREGQFAWSRDARSLAVWCPDQGGTFNWQCVIEPYKPFTPRLWIGVTEFAPSADSHNIARYRRFFGACQFYVAQKWGVLGGPATGDIGMLPPIPPHPVAVGGFGTMYVTPMDSAAPEVGFGVFNGTITLSGAPYPGQLAIASPKDGRLLNVADLSAADSGLFFCYASGQFPYLPELI